MIIPLYARRQFLVANKLLYIRVGPWVRPLSERFFFPNRGIQAKKWSNFQQYPWPTFATSGRVSALLNRTTFQTGFCFSMVHAI